MRRPLSTCRSGLSVAAAVVLLTACGGSDEESSAPDSATTAAESSTAESTARAAGSEFCTQAASIQERLEATATGVSDPRQLPQVLQEAAEEIRAIDAPAEIEADWTALADGAQRFSEAIAGIDFGDPEGVTTLEQELTPLQQELTSASRNVETYLTDECGIDAASAGATPDSSVADRLAARGVGESMVRELGAMADRTGYGLSPGSPLPFERAQAFAAVMVDLCDDIAGGGKTWQSAIAEDIADGAPAADAEAMNAYLRDDFCPRVR